MQMPLASIDVSFYFAPATDSGLALGFMFSIEHSKIRIALVPVFVLTRPGNFTHQSVGGFPKALCKKVLFLSYRIPAKKKSVAGQSIAVLVILAIIPIM
jgi:hypothetical protein